MSPFAIVLLILGLGLVAWLSARAKAAAFAAPGRAAGGARAHSLPAYHGWYVALWALVPALIFLTVWSSVSGGLVTQAVLESPAAASLPQLPMQRASILSEAQALAGGSLQVAFNPEAKALAPLYAEASNHYALIGGAAAMLLAFAGGAFAYSRVSPQFRARTRVERLVMGLLLIASLIAILTTLGIVLSLLFESLRFFSMVSPIALETARRTPPTTPGSAAGTSTFWIVSDLVAPIARLPSRIASGTALIESSAIDETKGMIMMPMTRPAASADSDDAPGMPTVTAKSRIAGAMVRAAK